jgi:hypothetical protein
LLAEESKRTWPFLSFPKGRSLRNFSVPESRLTTIMAVGISPSDIVRAIELAFKIYEKCFTKAERAGKLLHGPALGHCPTASVLPLFANPI